jgi:enterochelin esterase-like enzyme
MKKLTTLFRHSAVLALLLTGNALWAQTTGSFNQDITFMGATRRLSCYVPPGYNPSVPAKLMIGLHGLGDNSSAYRNALINSLGFAAAVPNTILVCPDGGSDPNSDFYVPAGDEAVIEAGIAFARANYNIDTTNIVLQGFSLGGRSALRYGLQHTGTFKGLLLNTPAVQGVKEAVTQWAAGGIFDYAQAPQIPIYITHGNTDEIYKGPIDSTYEQLARHNGMSRLVRFSGGHTVPALASIQEFSAFFDQPAVTGADAQAIKVLVAPRSCNTAVPAKVLVHNKGAETLSSIGLSYIWNGTPQHYTWTGTLPTFAHTEISLPVFTATAGNHSLAVTIDTLNGSPDTITDNNSATSAFRITTTPSLLPLRESFNDTTYDDRWLTRPSGDLFLPWSFDEDSLNIGSLNTIFIFNNSNQREEILSPVLNLSSLSNPYVAFDVAYNYTTFTADFLGMDTVFADTLEVLVSTDCGATYQSVYKKAGASLATFAEPIKNPTSIDAYFLTPADTNWRRELIDLSAYASSTDAVVKFSYISALGGVIFLDRIYFENAQTGISTIDKAKVQLYPNPATDQVLLNSGNALIEAVTVTDLSGRRMSYLEGRRQQSLTVPTAALPDGIYLFEISTNKGKLTHKVVVQH